MATENPSLPSDESRRAADVRLTRPAPGDGRELWRIARDSAALDVNSPYSYTLWCRDFAATSVVAHGPDGPCGFITGYVRPDAPDTLFVWQVAVDADHRGLGLARRMLDHLAAASHRFVEATVTPDNTASTRMFESFARDHHCELTRTELFPAEYFPPAGTGAGSHEPEVLFRIGPLPAPQPDAV